MASLRPTLAVRPIEHDSFFVVSGMERLPPFFVDVLAATPQRCPSSAKLPANTCRLHLLNVAGGAAAGGRRGSSRAGSSVARLLSHDPSCLCTLTATERHCLQLCLDCNHECQFEPVGQELQLLSCSSKEVFFSVHGGRSGLGACCRLTCVKGSAAAWVARFVRIGCGAGRTGGRSRTRWERKGWPLQAALQQGRPSSGRHGSKLMSGGCKAR